MRLSDVTPANRPYQPWGTAKEAMMAKDEEVLYVGPAGTGKSICFLNKLHLLCEREQGLRCLLIRKTRASLSDSSLTTFEDEVLPPGHYLLWGATREHRQRYRYKTKSEIVCGGMDKPSKILSTSWDIIYIPEAFEFMEEEIEVLSTRLARTVRKLKYSQILMDTNPDHPRHWLKLRCDKGLTRMIQSRHEDNPVLFDHTLNQWTEQGREYLAKLDRLTGARLQRFRYGRWAASEGQVYQHWSDKNLKNEVDLPADWKSWPMYWSIDFGYVNPFVWGCWAIDPDGAAVRVREIYMTGRIVKDHCDTIREVMQRDGLPHPRLVICDHDAEDRATFEREMRMNTVAAHKSISDGIQAVQTRIGRDVVTLPGENGAPDKVLPALPRRLFVLRDCLVERDPELDAAKKPCCMREEIDSYVWDNRNMRRQEYPIQKDDHGMDETRYFCAELDGLPEVKAKDRTLLISAVDRYAGISMAR